MKPIRLSTTPTLPDVSVETELGIVSACAMATTDFAGDLFAAMKNFIGGTVTNYEKLIDRASDRAKEKIVKQAVELVADAIVGIRFHIEAIPLKKGVIVAVHISGTAVCLANCPENTNPELHSRAIL